MPEKTNQGVNLLWVGLIVEGGLIVLALGLSVFGFYDHAQPIEDLDWATWLLGGKFGIFLLFPLLGYLVLFHFWTPSFYRPMQEIVDSRLRPMFSNATYIELLIISIMAGLGEELFFRWCLQGGITSLLEPHFGRTLSIFIGIAIASFLFGICHWVNSIYGISTMVVGAFLGLGMIWAGTWLAPAISHAVFDFVALVYIVNSKPKTVELPDR